MMLKSRALQGFAMIEFIIALPLLLLLLLISAELGRAFYQFNSLTKAVHSGARDYSRYHDENQAKTIVVYGNINATATALLPNFSTDAVTIDTSVANQVTVLARYDFEFLAGNPLNAVQNLFGNTPTTPLSFQASAVMPL